MSADIFGSFTSETQWDLPEQSSFQAHPLPPTTAQPQIGIFKNLSLGEGVSCPPPLPYHLHLRKSFLCLPFISFLY